MKAAPCCSRQRWVHALTWLRMGLKVMLVALWPGAVNSDSCWWLFESQIRMVPSAEAVAYCGALGFSATALTQPQWDRSRVVYWWLGMSRVPMTPFSEPTRTLRPSGDTPTEVTAVSCSACSANHDGALVSVDR